MIYIAIKLRLHHILYMQIIIVSVLPDYLCLNYAAELSDIASKSILNPLVYIMATHHVTELYILPL